MTDRLVDRDYLSGVQYASDANLSARQAIYRFQQPIVGISAWAIDLAEFRGNECVIDVGCGNGMYLAELARAVIEAHGAFRIRTDVGCFVCR